MTRSVVVALAVVSLAVVLVIANPWRGAPNRAPAESTVATRGFQDERPAARTTAPVAEDAAPPLATAAPAPAADASVSADQEFKAVIEGIDPLLVERNVIMLSPPPDQTGPGFVELESRFGTESADATWSRGMEARILDQVAQVSGLKLVSLETECRATICRVKLFHPPGTNALTSLDSLVPIATRIGFAHVARVATLGENRVPISLLYFQRPPPSAESAR